MLGSHAVVVWQHWHRRRVGQRLQLRLRLGGSLRRRWWLGGSLRGGRRLRGRRSLSWLRRLGRRLCLSRHIRSHLCAELCTATLCHWRRVHHLASSWWARRKARAHRRRRSRTRCGLRLWLRGSRHVGNKLVSELVGDDAALPGAVNLGLQLRLGHDMPGTEGSGAPSRAVQRTVVVGAGRLEHFVVVHMTWLACGIRVVGFAPVAVDGTWR